MFSGSRVCLLALASLVHGQVDDASMSHFDRAAASSGWTRNNPSRPDEDVQLSFFVKQTHTKRLEQLLRNVSDPSSPSYGHYLTKAQVDALTAPRSEDIATVQAALRGYPVEVREDGALIQTTVPVSFAQGLLGGDFFYYCRQSEAHRGQSCTLRNPTADVPRALGDACDLITPLGEPLPPPPFTGPTRSSPDALAQGSRLPADLNDMPQRAQATVVQSQAAIAQAQHFFDSTVESPIPPPGFDAGSEGHQPNATHQEVCCFSIGYGALMRPCCLTTWHTTVCNSRENLTGGAIGYRSNGCPASAGEAAQLIEEERSQASNAAVAQPSLSPRRPLLSAKKPTPSASTPPSHRMRVMPVGCCWTIGFGDLMEPCCLHTREAADESNCFVESPQRRLADSGGKSGYNATGCPGTSSEAQSWALANDHGLPPVAAVEARPSSAVLGSGTTTAKSDSTGSLEVFAADKLVALVAVLAFIAAMALALRPRTVHRTRPLLQSSPADTADDAAE